MLNEDIFSKEVEEQLKYLRTGLQNGNKTHYPINLCFIDTHGKIFELKETFKRLEILDDIAKKFNVDYVLHFEEQTFVAIFDYQKNWSDSCYQQSINLINKLQKSFLKLNFLKTAEDKFSAIVSCIIILLFIFLLFIDEFDPQTQIKMTNLDMLGFLIIFVLIIIDWQFEKYIKRQKAKLNNNLKK